MIYRTLEIAALFSSLRDVDRAVVLEERHPVARRVLLLQLEEDEAVVAAGRLLNLG